MRLVELATHEIRLSKEREERRTLHAVAGRALEALYADRLEEAYDRLAYHYARTDEASKAIGYLTRFAEKAARSYAHAEAVTALQEALRHVERLPTAARDHCVLDIVLRLAHSLYFLGRFQETLALLLRSRLGSSNFKSRYSPALIISGVLTPTITWVIRSRGRKVPNAL